MIMQNDDSTNRKYVFVCGLPRSGTSVIARNIGRLHNCTGLKDTGVLEDEGQFLQDVYPLAGDCGGDGRFGFDPRMHLTETSDLLTPENVARLHKSWNPYWDRSKTIYLEKTPANLLMTRFLQVAFPNSYFVVIRRHPVPVSIAIQKWKVNITSLYNLFEHWLQCYDLFEQDKMHLKHLYELRYEDYVENPGKYHEEIAAFLGTRVLEPPEQDKFRLVTKLDYPSGLQVPEMSMEQTSGAYNRKYFDRWSDLLTNSPFRGYYRYIARKYQPRFTKYGYSLTRGLGIDEDVIDSAKIPAALGAFYCQVADASAMLWRFRTRARCRIRQQVKAALPEPVLARIKQARGRGPSKQKEQKEAGMTSP
jgi:Sulfotransferase family